MRFGMQICDMVAEHLWRRIQRIHIQKAGELMKFEYQKKVASLSKLKNCSTYSEASEKSRAVVSHLHIIYIVDMQSMDPTVSKINSLRSACCRKLGLKFSTLPCMITYSIDLGLQNFWRLWPRSLMMIANNFLLVYLSMADLHSNN